MKKLLLIIATILSLSSCNPYHGVTSDFGIIKTIHTNDDGCYIEVYFYNNGGKYELQWYRIDYPKYHVGDTLYLRP